MNYCFLHFCYHDKKTLFSNFVYLYLIATRNSVQDEGKIALYVGLNRHLTFFCLLCFWVYTKLWHFSETELSDNYNPKNFFQAPEIAINGKFRKLSNFSSLFEISYAEARNLYNQNLLNLRFYVRKCFFGSFFYLHVTAQKTFVRKTLT